MKEKIKNTKGITLVALIITIIVLLILAVVAITSISNSNIIKHAQNGRDAYDLAKKNEQGALAKYEQYLDDNNPSNNNGNKDDDPSKGNEDNIEWFYFKDGGQLLYIGNATEITLTEDLPIKVYTQNGDPVDDEENEVTKVTAGEIKTTNLNEMTDVEEIVFEADSWKTSVYNADGTLIKTIPDLSSITKITVSGSVLEKYKKSKLVTNSMVEVVILDGATTIQSGLFCQCEKLEKVTLPNTITTIGHENFFECTQPIVIEYNGTKAQWNSIAIENTSEISNVTVKCTDGNITY